MNNNYIAATLYCIMHFIRLVTWTAGIQPQNILEKFEI